MNQTVIDHFTGDARRYNTTGATRYNTTGATRAANDKADRKNSYGL